MTRLRLTRCTVDLVSGAVEDPAGPSALTPRELELLRWLAARPGTVVERDVLQVEAFGYAPTATTRAVDKTMVNLRKKVEVDPSAPDHLRTAPGGYRFDPLEEPSAALPPERDAFVGRAAELEQISRKLAHPGVVALIGPGGAGKTRLALRVARAWRQGPSVWIPLGDASPDDVARHVAVVLGVPLDGGPAAEARLGRAIGALGDALVVLDEVEHLAHRLGVVEALRANAPRARFLLTSRVAVCDVVVPIGPLLRDDAIALLAARADARGCAIDAGTLAPLAAQLEDLPLALELAAGWLDVLGPAALAARFGDPSRAALVDLDAALERSWALLDPAARQALAELSVFRGGFELDAAEAVLSPPGDGQSIAEVVRGLVRASLVDRRNAGATVRLRLLETVRIAAARRLDGDARRRASLAHARAYGRLGAIPSSRIHVAELDNLVAAVRHAIAAGAPADGLAALDGVMAAASLCDAWPTVETLASELADATTGADRGRALLALAFARNGLDRDPTPALDAAAPLLADDRAGTARLLVWRGRVAVRGGDPDGGRRHLDAALAMEPEPRRGAVALSALADLAQDRGAWDESVALYRRALEIHHAAGDALAAARTQQRIGISLRHMGDHAGARGLYLLAAETFERLGARRLLASVRGNLAAIALVEGDLAGAARAYTQQVDEHRASGDAGAAAQTLGNLGGALIALGHLAEARAALSEALAHSASCEVIVALTVHIRWGALLVAEGPAEAACDELAATITALEAADARFFLIDARAERYVALRAAGRDLEAEGELSAAIRLVEVTGNVPSAQRAVDDAMARAARSRGLVRTGVGTSGAP